MDGRMLLVIDEDGRVLGEKTREEIHEKGLLHMEVHVWFYMPDGKIIFQHRAKDTDTFPDLLDTAVGGHVEIGDTYEGSAVKEAEEETGVRLESKDLQLLDVITVLSLDSVTGKRNHARKAVYAYRYAGALEDLRIEEGKAVGFEAWDIDELLALSADDARARRFIPGILMEVGKGFIRKIQALI